TVRNKHLEAVFEAKGINTKETWTSILEHEGSVAHLDDLSEDEKAVFRTAFELDQRWIIELAADRAPLICQAQSLNIFIPGDVNKWDLHMLHWNAWEKGIKSLYYCRSKSVQRAAFAGNLDKPANEPKNEMEAAMQAAAPTDYEECLACQ
ncbi:MAG TPA: ribonucleotide-diphosphate reductase subunit alpha, partial [Ghiorsea sp.]|nr:ribonucleotide-diphosphate reductase subunit alpha [Ghiorsea sp.]